MIGTQPTVLSGAPPVFVPGLGDPTRERQRPVTERPVSGTTEKTSEARAEISTQDYSNVSLRRFLTLSRVLCCGSSTQREAQIEGEIQKKPVRYKATRSRSTEMFSGKAANLRNQNRCHLSHQCILLCSTFFIFTCSFHSHLPEM